MTRPTGPLIAVSAVEHPQRDAWVDEHAAIAAAESGVTLGEYLGREDVLGPRRPAGLCCHLFAATAKPAETVQDGSDVPSDQPPGVDAPGTRTAGGRGIHDAPPGRTPVRRNPPQALP